MMTSSAPQTVRDAFFDVLRQYDLTTVFANPGSTEISLLANLPADINFTLALHEGSVVGMATGYALARQIDNDLFRVGTAFGNGTLDLTTPVSGTCTGAQWVHNNSYYCDASTGLTAYAVDQVVSGDVFTDACFRALIKKMDDADVPMTDRVLIVPPALRSAIMGVDRYVSSDFTDARSVQSGLIGNVYGIQIYVSSNCPLIEDATSNTAGTIDLRGAFFFHKDAIILGEQMSVRSQTQYKQEYLSTLYTADTLYGVQAHRPEAGFCFVVLDA
jgi:hypothetical protein